MSRYVRKASRITFSAVTSPLAGAAAGLSSVPCCCRYFLVQHPQAMARLEAELDAAGLLVTAQRPQPRAFTYADISKLRYLDCVIKVRVQSYEPRGVLVSPQPMMACSFPSIAEQNLAFEHADRFCSKSTSV